MIDKKRQFRHSLLNKIISAFLLLLVIIGMIYAGYQIAETYREKPDFGGVVTLRQADMDLEFDGETVHLSREEIMEYITSRKVLEPIAKKYKWDVPFDKMVEATDVKERLSSQRSFVILVNTMNVERSNQVARALSFAYLEHYRKAWTLKSRGNLVACDRKIRVFNQELAELRAARRNFQERKQLIPVNSVDEMRAVNDQLVEAQKQFLAAYGAYMIKMEEKRSELQLQYDLARQTTTDNNAAVRRMKLQLQELDRQCADLRIKLAKQKPNLYRLSLTPQKLEGLPNDILYFYDNVQTLQQLKLALMMDSIIEEKQSMLDKEKRKKNTIERLIATRSCDVFIREVGR